MALSQTSVIKLYNTVVEDVIAGVRDCFLDDGVDETVLQELRTLWKKKLTESGAMDPPQPERVEHVPPPILQNFQKTNGAGSKRAAVSHHPVAHEPQQSSSRQPLQEATQHAHVPPHAHAPPHAHVPQNHMTTPASGPMLSNDRVPVQLTLPAQAGVPGSQPRVFTIQIPASALNGQQLHQVLTGPIISATLNLPQPLAATLLQQHINAALAGHDSGGGGGAKGAAPFRGLDGAEDSSEEEGSVAGGEGSGAGSDPGAADEEEEEEDDEELEEEEEQEPAGTEEEPLNSGDDVSDEEPGDMFDTENVVVCQYDKITRSRNRWKFYLKDGIMNLTGKDFVFQKANGDAEW